MSPWLKPRLLALFGAAFLGGATYLHAQTSYPAPAKTPGEAATAFYRLLAPNSEDQHLRSERWIAGADMVAQDGLISRVQAKQFAASGEQLNRLFALLDQEFNEPRFEAKAGAADGGQILVQVTPRAAGTGREVVVIPEDGGYRVDLKATYARWNNLSGEALDESWWKYTGVVSPSLRTNSNFLNVNCQSNLKQLGIAVMQYTQDYDERMPPARKWQDVTPPYVQNRAIYRCPSLSKGNGYAFNSKLSLIPLAGINATALTIQLYETSNPALSVAAPFTGRAYRHILHDKEGMNICFTDGHIKWFSRGYKANLYTIEPAAPATGFLTISTNSTP